MQYLNNISYEQYEGSILQSRDFGEFEVIKCNSSREILIEFVETGFRKICQTKEIKTGVIQDRSVPSVFGVGVLGDKYPTKYKLPDNKSKPLKEYETWVGLLKRCYSTLVHKKRPSYSNCMVSKNFQHYTYFYEWCNEQVGFNNAGWHLDKDILFKGNKVYSENTCVFVPSEINCLFIKTNKLRGEYPIGVHYDTSKKKFISQIHRNNAKGCQDYLGTYDCPKEAFLAYKVAKELHIKEVAEKWKDQIDPKVYNALISYEVEITD